MEIQELFGLLKRLTSQNSIRNLITAFRDLLAENFEEVTLKIFELQPTRVENERTAHVMCLDCEYKVPSFFLNKQPVFQEAFNKSEAIVINHNAHVFQAVHPVVLYDNSISHLISVQQTYSEKSSQALLIGFLDIFTDIFRSIHEKGYDPLTRTLNRQAFDQTATEMAYSSKDSANDTYGTFNAIAILDIDKFKDINDQFGHAMGDETLVLFAQTIRSVLRQEDLFFRYGGEEFVIFVKDVEHEQALHVLERCRNSIENRSFPQIGSITVSIGFTNLDRNYHPLENLSKADKALYFIKKNGRNNVQSYEQLVDSKLLEPIILKQGSADFWD